MRVALIGSDAVGGRAYARFVVDAPLLLWDDPRAWVEPDDDWIEPDDEGWETDGESQAADDGPWSGERTKTNVWTARIDGSGVSPGDVAEIVLEPGRLHVFDPRTGEPIDQ